MEENLIIPIEFFQTYSFHGKCAKGRVSNEIKIFANSEIRTSDLRTQKYKKVNDFDEIRTRDLWTNWNPSKRGSHDVKELIPELFYLSEMFKNENNYDLGTMSENGHQVDDVVLPNWAKVCCLEFLPSVRPNSTLSSLHFTLTLFFYRDFLDTRRFCPHSSIGARERCSFDTITQMDWFNIRL